MEIIYKRVADLIPYAGNPRKNDHAVAPAAAIIKRFGFRIPLLIKSDDEVIDGHLRLKAAAKLGREEVPCIIVDDMSDNDIRALRISVNRLAEKADWDDELLELELGELELLGISREEIGFEVGEAEGLKNLDEIEIAEDEIPEVPAEPITKRGDLWLLGDHRLLCGDSTNADDVKRLMDREKANLCQTDPPYGIAYVSNAHSKGQAVSHVEIENDGLDGEKLQSFLEETIRAAVPWLKDNCAFYLWHPMLTQGAFFAAAAAAAADILIHRQIIWCKPSLVFGRGDYHWQHELCFYGWRKGNRPPFYGARNQTTLWHIDRETIKEHPTAKPVAIWKQPLCNHTLKGEVCYEPFGGSGSQIIAAEQLGRKCYSMEISPNYCDVIVKRWETLTGKKASIEKHA